MHEDDFQSYIKKSLRDLSPVNRALLSGLCGTLTLRSGWELWNSNNVLQSPLIALVMAQLIVSCVATIILYWPINPIVLVLLLICALIKALLILLGNSLGISVDFALSIVKAVGISLSFALFAWCFLYGMWFLQCRLKGKSEVEELVKVSSDEHIRIHVE